MAKKEEAKEYSVNGDDVHRRQLEKQIEELHKEHEECIKQNAVEKFSSVSRIMRTVAHEIRNPLTNIGLALEQLNSEITGSPDASLLTEMIQRNTTRINTLINELLESTRFAQLDYTSVSINELLDDVLERVRNFARHKNVPIDEDFTEPLPKLLLDADKIKTAFENLLTNSIESVQPTEGKIFISTANENHKCVVTIRHNGSAIPADKLERMFEPYFLSKGSTGLVLTQTQNIILNHGGSIYIESEPGKGTTFTVILGFV